ncbi:MAG: hypothetical protein M0Z38_05665 [Deltaproteobacteria bacterium]|nr:hypothetical protein [Deltaproteobacteria bacterium]
MREKIAFLVIFAAAMAFVEAAVVVYLRDLLGGGPIFPMKYLSPKLLAVEIGREGATVVMLLCVASLPFRGGARRMGAFLLVFAAWDVFYYLWLRVTIGWPAGIAAWDVLFLIPLPWVGPVWSVLLICAGMIAFSVAFLRTSEDAPFAPGLSGWATGVAGSLAVIATYILEWRKIGYGAGIPDAFSLLPFFLGILLLAVSGWITYRSALSAGRRGTGPLLYA